MLKLHRSTYIDKLHACWLGKNIGGTLGAPYEGTRAMLDIQNFSSPCGEPLPNDDLDLQLVWLAAMEEVGPKNLNANLLSEYWLDWIPPHWNEYGIAKTNLRLGLLPPMSGEVDNEKWKTSNGAWIRSEIWAGLSPVAVDGAIRYAVMDAMVDHGVSEGTYAEIFTAALQSAAYAESNITVLLHTALSKIPEGSMTAKTVRLVMSCYDEGLDYKETREKVVAFNEPLGWFQAPANLGFVVIGLLWGQGDFKRSVLYAINCGDDTDCTGATVGATLGIIGGTASIPEDWKQFVGDRIVTVSISGMYALRVPKTCYDLTERIAALVPSVMASQGVDFAFTDEVTVPDAGTVSSVQRLTADDLLNRSPYSYDITHYHALSVRVELDETPRVRPGETRQVTLTFFCNPRVQESRKLQLRMIPPEGWEVGPYDRTVSLPYAQPAHSLWGNAKTSFTVTAGPGVEVINRVYAEITCPTLPYPLLIPITFIG